jgi:hypothetical protein
VALPSPANIQRTKLPHAKEVLSLQLQVQKRAKQLADADIAKHGKPHRLETHKALQESAMCSLMYGFLPPLRLACVRTLIHPSRIVPPAKDGEAQLLGGCLEPDCR